MGVKCMKLLILSPLLLMFVNYILSPNICILSFYYLTCGKRKESTITFFCLIDLGGRGINYITFYFPFDNKQTSNGSGKPGRQWETEVELVGKRKIAITKKFCSNFSSTFILGHALHRLLRNWSGKVSFNLSFLGWEEQLEE